MLEILCIGHAAYDISVFLPQFPLENSKGESDQVLESGGGPAANAAYLLSSWGVACGLATTLGDDEYGHKIMAQFQGVGTDLSLTEIKAGHRTPVSVILVNLENGSRTLVNWKAQKSSLRLNPARLGGLWPRVLLLDGHELDASLAAMQAFPDAVSILDAGSLHAGTAALAGRVHYLVASEKFALQASAGSHLAHREQPAECLLNLKSKYQNRVVITLGERGLIAENAGACRVLPAFKVHPVDTTAAGDIFHGAFAYAVLRQMEFGQGLEFASMAAAMSVEKRGGRPSIPALAEVRKALSHAH
jgi:sulfofructose kinase